MAFIIFLNLINIRRSFEKSRARGSISNHYRVCFDFEKIIKSGIFARWTRQKLVKTQERWRKDQDHGAILKIIIIKDDSGNHTYLKKTMKKKVKSWWPPFIVKLWGFYSTQVQTRRSLLRLQKAPPPVKVANLVSHRQPRRIHANLVHPVREWLVHLAKKAASHVQVSFVVFVLCNHLWTLINDDVFTVRNHVTFYK